MSPLNRSIPVIVLVACFVFSTVSAHNITQMLEKDPNYSNFNDLLTETGLAKEINGRKTITVLAIPNDQMGELNGKPMDAVKNVLKTHIILDYYDPKKLEKSKGPTTLTTLFQSTGIADKNQGFVNSTSDHGNVAFGSAVKDSKPEAQLTGSLGSQPYNISVLGVSQQIHTPGLETANLAPAPAPPKKAPAPKKAKGSADSPDDATDASDAPDVAEAPAEDDDAAAGAPPEKKDADDTDEDKQAQSSGQKVFASTVGVVVMVVVSCIASL